MSGLTSPDSTYERGKVAESRSRRCGADVDPVNARMKVYYYLLD